MPVSTEALNFAMRILDSGGKFVDCSSHAIAWLVTLTERDVDLHCSVLVVAILHVLPDEGPMQRLQGWFSSCR